MSTVDQYENARHLGEIFVETIRGLQLLAVRDLEDGSGVTLVVRFNDKDTELMLTFDELAAARGGEGERRALFARWSGQVSATGVPLAGFLPRPPRTKAKK